MKRALLIAEKPSLMRDIQSAYKANFKSMTLDIDFIALHGHFIEQCSPEEYSEEWGKPWRKEVLPMIPTTFKTKAKKECKKDFESIKVKMNTGGYDYIINACDAGREGQAIFGLLYDKAGCKVPTLRLWSDDTTEESLSAALMSLRDGKEPLFQHMTDASYQRMQFDWLVGMNLSRAITLTSGRAIAVGRVMTPTLNIVVQRDLEIANFSSKKFFEVEADFDKYKGTWFDKDEPSITVFDDKAKAEKLVSKLGKSGKVDSINVEKVIQAAPPLFSLTTLQQQANRSFGFTGQQTTELAQSLYETHKVLSYPRTECQVLSTALSKEIDRHLKAISGITDIKNYVEDVLKDKSAIDKTMKSKKYVDNTKLTDHHAIIPTMQAPNFGRMSDNEKKLYMLVVKRFLSIFMPPYITSKTTIITDIDGEKFKTVGSNLVDWGFKVLFDPTKNDANIPALTKGETVPIKALNVNEKETTPPPYYNDDTLLGAMANAGKFVDNDEYADILKETKGIGTTATRAGILEKLFEKNMLVRKGKQIRATDFGFDVISILDNREIISPILTAEWEKKLLEIESGKLDLNDFKKDMISYVEKETSEFLKNTRTVSNIQGKEVGTCPACGSAVVESKSCYICKKYQKDGTGCSFVLGKMIAGKKITQADLKKIFAGQKTATGKFKSKEGKVFEASLVFNSQSKKVEFAFEGKETGGTNSSDSKPIGKCPDCGGEVLDRGKFCKCSKCDFSLSYEIRGTKLTMSDIKKLMKGETTDEKQFTWSSGKKGLAKIQYKDKKLNFIFPERK